MCNAPLKHPTTRQSSRNFFRQELIENQNGVEGEKGQPVQNFEHGKIFQGPSFIVRSQTLMLKQSPEMMNHLPEQKGESTEERNMIRLSVTDPRVLQVMTGQQFLLISRRSHSHTSRFIGDANKRLRRIVLKRQTEKSILWSCQTRDVVDYLKQRPCSSCSDPTAQCLVSSSVLTIDGKECGESLRPKIL